MIGKNNYFTSAIILIVLTVSLMYMVTTQSFALSPSSCRVYDDFSSGQLNPAKWAESTWHGQPFTDEHFVSHLGSEYHVQQNVERDAETNLAPRRQFFAGESFSYEVTYRGGSGNHQSQPLINGNYPPSQIEPCDFRTAGCGAIGYWNAFPDLGAHKGTYRITYEFFPTQVKMTAIRPDGVVIVNTLTGNSEPYTLTINTHTGHNGRMHFDYDNFTLCDGANLLPKQGHVNSS